MALDTGEIETLLKEALPESEVSVQGGDGKYQVTAVDRRFEGLNAVKRQQAVYAILNPHIASGAIHAVSMQLLTPEEAART
ncbi:MAG: BolA/IbaG family iron-sulfur metabolism protein [Pseudohongiellaceae bacterium]